MSTFNQQQSALPINIATALVSGDAESSHLRCVFGADAEDRSHLRSVFGADAEDRSHLRSMFADEAEDRSHLRSLF